MKSKEDAWPTPRAKGMRLGEKISIIKRKQCP